jgi:hypothetical protein
MRAGVASGAARNRCRGWVVRAAEVGSIACLKVGTAATAAAAIGAVGMPNAVFNAVFMSERGRCCGGEDHAEQYRSKKE